MYMLRSIALASTLVAGISAQSDLKNETSETVWAAVAFINNGERTPIMGRLNTVLTPEGAQQMLNQGTAFRARYLRSGVNGTAWKDVERAYIQHMNMDVIDNGDMEVVAQTDEWFTAGALAFMQGLYPPVTSAWDDATGFREISQNYLEGDNETDYPLQGYQYPNLHTWGISDPQSTAIQGNLRCSAWQSEMRYNLTNDDYLRTLWNSTYDFYQELFTSQPLAGTISLEAANFWNAYYIYDYVSYMYTHNETVHNNLRNANITLGRLEGYATEVERARHVNANGASNSDPLNTLYTISGRTLAERVAQNFLTNVQWKANRDKLTLMFGSYEPMVSFMSISGLLTPQAITAGPFHSLPQPGAAMVFELYGEDSTNPDLQPSEDKLKVRFYYRASADVNEKFEIYPLFNATDDDPSMSFINFIQSMQFVGKSAYEWCDICGASTAPWCVAAYSAVNGNGKGNGIDPAIAGIIGAVITLAVIFIIVGALIGLCGFRLSRSPRSKDDDKIEAVMSTSGGFKGPEKKEGDQDVKVNRAGIHHERVGSWELRDGSTLPTLAGITSKTSPAKDSRTSLDDDAISVMGATPVKPHESV